MEQPDRNQQHKQQQSDKGTHGAVLATIVGGTKTQRVRWIAYNKLDDVYRYREVDADSDDLEKYIFMRSSVSTSNFPYRYFTIKDGLIVGVSDEVVRTIEQL